MTAYEGVLSCYVFAMETFCSSAAEVDEMCLELLLDLISVHEKLSDSVKERSEKRQVYIDEVLW